MDDARKWNEKYRQSEYKDLIPVKVLLENQHLLPSSGRALDLACGRGANALFLAERGLETHAWDISDVVITQLDQKASELKLQLNAQQRDVVSQPPEPDSFDVMVVSRFLERKITPTLIAALRRDGLVFYQTFIREKTNDTGPKNPDYRLDNNELLELFHPLHIVYYREEGTLGDIQQGFRNEAMLIGQKLYS